MPPLMDWTRHSAVQLAAMIQQRTLTSTALVSACLARIEAVNPALNALVQVCAEEALVEARQADLRIARGECCGPLHGVPFTVKDVIDTAGVVSAAGLVERAGHIPTQDAVVVARMKQAGAILLGRSNCPAGGGGGVTDNALYGATLNPHDRGCGPGGSSGGEAAAIAAGFSPIGLGSDSGGSLRVPAHFCGICTLKPTSGRVPSSGVFDHPGGLSDPRSQVGPMARHVEDLAVVHRVIAGPDQRDAAVIPMPSPAFDSVAVHGLKLAWYDQGDIVAVDADTRAALQAATGILAAAGVQLQAAFPAALAQSRVLTERYWTLAQGSGADAVQLFADWDHYRTAMLAFFGDYDAILCPVDAGPAPRRGEHRADLFGHTLPYSLTGWPCVVIRAGSSADGLPIGVQIVARPWQEHVALALARAIEVALPFSSWPKGWAQ